MKLIVVRPLLIDVLHMDSKAATLLDIPFATDLYDGRSHPRVSAADHARGVEIRFAVDARDPRATNPDPVLLTEVKRARRGFDALVSGRIGSLAELASREGISDRNEAGPYKIKVMSATNHEAPPLRHAWVPLLPAVAGPSRPETGLHRAGGDLPRSRPLSFANTGARCGARASSVMPSPSSSGVWAKPGHRRHCPLELHLHCRRRGASARGRASGARPVVLVHTTP